MSNATLVPPKATLADLYREKGKAELVGGRIVRFMPTGGWPALIAGEIFVSLRLYGRKTKRGRAYPDGVGYAVPPLASGRQSFSPDTSFYDGPAKPKNMQFIQGAPLLAVEVRSDNDYGVAAEIEISAKRADYFTAGTQVVWDVDPHGETVASYHAGQPTQPTIFRRGETANAEPVLPGWRMAIDDIFDVQ